MQLVERSLEAPVGVYNVLVPGETHNLPPVEELDSRPPSVTDNLLAWGVVHNLLAWGVVHNLLASGELNSLQMGVVVDIGSQYSPFSQV
ncbi:hypothetical protein KSZ_06990 [Dictyobacter formicarum]|uniref:Uncharacterized protein n=1 Tax=Dictyobacter formicarum TaxID=2778368 RepID=A0ABQ3VA61_9CHLR|nr:hypothetical protein KSZ_06990 [Dictyobacter formicarum]